MRGSLDGVVLSKTLTMFIQIGGWLSHCACHRLSILQGDCNQTSAGPWC